MGCVSSIKQYIHDAEHPAKGYKNNCLEQAGVALYAPLGSVVKLYEEQENCLAKAALAVAGVFAMAIALVGALFKKIGECFNSSIKEKAVANLSPMGKELSRIPRHGEVTRISSSSGVSSRPKTGTSRELALQNRKITLEELTEKTTFLQNIKLTANIARVMPTFIQLQNATESFGAAMENLVENLNPQQQQQIEDLFHAIESVGQILGKTLTQINEQQGGIEQLDVREIGVLVWIVGKGQEQFMATLRRIAGENNPDFNRSCEQMQQALTNIINFTKSTLEILCPGVDQIVEELGPQVYASLMQTAGLSAPGNSNGLPEVVDDAYIQVIESDEEEEEVSELLSDDNFLSPETYATNLGQLPGVQGLLSAIASQ